MVGTGFRIGRVLGIPIHLHASWFLLFALITFSWVSYFTNQHPHWSESQHWAAGILSSLLFFGSVLFHELAHSVVALRYKIPVVSITLFVFGGVARIGREARTAGQEFKIAVAGPVSSYLLAGAFYLVASAGVEGGMLRAVASWLALINFALATFNLIPGFPLDGGRILRSIVWQFTGNFTRATRMASVGGQLIAYLMILVGIYSALTNELLGRFDGIWWTFIGWFLLSAAQESFAQVAIRNSLAGVRAGDIMSAELPTVPRSISVLDYVDEIVRTGRRCHLVQGADELVGLISVHSVSKIRREEWDTTSVQAAMIPREHVHVTSPDEPVLNLLERMQTEDINQMPVVSGNRVVGLISRDTILRVIQTRMEMGKVEGQ
ncbi:MAG: site-2 protease family protein [Acidobacteria bacterium]|nr:site-2 protease family protein [Acidobacteriota bacterium]MCL5288146.1 site-2 protease family protein [Acidobacteriota bacterium]